MSFSDTKPHYALLDGLRGVAALLVVFYHIHEGFAFASGAPVIGTINHGYLAVDFFFMLSGFVIGYAYDDRLHRSMSLADFARRRLIRLHPMVIFGAIVGTICFAIQGCTQWDGTQVSWTSIMLALLCAMLFIPAIPGCSYEVRGNGEAFPLNGPAWSLFFEYIGNIIYALFISRCRTRVVGALAVVLGLCLAVYTWTDASGAGSLSVGWTMADYGILTGSLRMLFPFTCGIFLSRIFKPVAIKGAFWICSAILLALFIVPVLPTDGAICLNGVYESACIIVAFPILVWLGASGQTRDAFSNRVCKFLGDISFPLYITHYPVMYLFYKWLMDTEQYTMAETWPVALGVMALNILVAYAALRLYDEPVRRWLSRRK